MLQLMVENATGQQLEASEAGPSTPSDLLLPTQVGSLAWELRCGAAMRSLEA